MVRIMLLPLDLAMLIKSKMEFRRPRLANSSTRKNILFSRSLGSDSTSRITASKIPRGLFWIVEELKKLIS